MQYSKMRLKMTMCHICHKNVVANSVSITRFHLRKLSKQVKFKDIITFHAFRTNSSFINDGKVNCSRNRCITPDNYCAISVKRTENDFFYGEVYFYTCYKTRTELSHGWLLLQMMNLMTTNDIIVPASVQQKPKILLKT